jgi:hypothetical protein
MKLDYSAQRVHGMRWHEEPALCWWQYWRGIRHTWRWHGITVRIALRRRDRPMHEFIQLL